MWLEGARSISYVHVQNEECYPLWTISYWINVLDTRDLVRRPWQAAHQWNNKQETNYRHPHRQIEAKIAKSLLHTLPWQKQIHHGIENPELLARLLGTEKVNTSLMDIMLQGIGRRVQEEPKLAQTYLVQPLALLKKVVEGMEGKVDEYKNQSAWAWVRQIGEEVFLKGKVLVTAAHIGDLGVGNNAGLDHWVPVVVDGRDETFLYGDSLTSKPVIPPRLANTLQAWKDIHTICQYQTTPLPTSIQVDSYSCGFMAINALEAMIFSHVKLVDSQDVASMRLQTFNQIVTNWLNDDDDVHSDDGSESGSSEVELVEPEGSSLSASTFTFTCSRQASPALHATDSTTLLNNLSPKRKLHHGSTPTPQASPQKKHVKPSKKVLASEVPKFSLQLLDDDDATADNHSSDDDCNYEGGTDQGSSAAAYNDDDSVNAGEKRALRQGSLDNFFFKVSKERWEEMWKESFEAMANTAEVAEQEKAWIDAEKKERALEINRERQQRF
ncbi:hypothetical protein VKT23_004472 [Stygiomarasmius scandens]|uniref:Ubiquitin-like protease family profile domain-containing protein n=1 Tax=Marasmiellus scandens TaxID=2682957 RepID=A0ABR1JYS4_9AGAR